MSGESLPEQTLRLAEMAPNTLGVPVDQFEFEQSSFTEHVFDGQVPPQQLAQFAWPVRSGAYDTTCDTYSFILYCTHNARAYEAVLLVCSSITLHYALDDGSRVHVR